jgi:hypothetical protein
MPRGRDHFDNGSSELGLSAREQAEITGKALGGHMWEGFTRLFGGEEGLRQDYVNDAWSDAHAHYQGHDIRPSEDDYPEMHHDLGDGVTARYPIGGSNITFYQDGEPLEAAHVESEDRLNPDAVKQRAESFMQYYRGEGEV